MTLSDRKAIVTGASRGIGAAIARALDAAGVQTLLVARDAAALAELSASIKRGAPFPADLRHPDAALQVCEAATERLGGPPDIMINNAGAFSLAPVEATDDGMLAAAVSLNLAAPLRFVRTLLPGMRAAKRGDVVTIGSIADRTIYPSNAAYAATKFGARALHEVMLTELRGSGVRASLVSPGPTDTPLWDAFDSEKTAGLAPRSRMLRPDDVAEAVVWVLSRPRRVNIDELRLSHS